MENMNQNRKDRGRLILFVGVYDTLDIFMYEIQKELERLGYETMLFDSSQMNQSLVTLSEYVKRPVKAALTFNNLGFNMELVPGKNLWDELEIVMINILMDHPFCYKKALDAAPRNGIVLCPDRKHMAYLNRFYPGLMATGFLPHGGKYEPGQPVKPWEERKKNVMYAGNLSRSFVANIMPDLSKLHYSVAWDLKQMCDEVVEDVIAHPRKTTEEGMEEWLLSHGIHLEDDELCQVIADLHYIDLLIVSHYRERIVQAVAESGLELDLYGAGWENCSWIHASNVHYHGKVSAYQVVEEMKDSKVILSTMTWFKDGTHDRVFNGMLQGALTVSDCSDYMVEEFQGGASYGEENQEMILFSLDEMDTLGERIRELLQDEERAREVAMRGREHAIRAHSLQERARELDRDLLSVL